MDEKKACKARDPLTETSPDRGVIDLGSIDAFLFDLDGVVTRTAGVHAKAWKKLLDEYLERRARAVGSVFAPFDVIDDYQNYVDGRPRQEGVKSFLEARGINLPEGDPSDSPDAETLNGLGKRKDRYFLESLAEEGAQLCEGVRAFIETARGRGVRTAIVSSSENCAAVLAAAGASDLFDVRVDGKIRRELELRGKPAPDTYLEAAKRLNSQPNRAAIFEDALVGVEAGRAGGFGLVVGVGHGQHAADLAAHGADIVVDNLASLSLVNRKDD